MTDVSKKKTYKMSFKGRWIIKPSFKILLKEIAYLGNGENIIEDKRYIDYCDTFETCTLTKKNGDRGVQRGNLS